MGGGQDKITISEKHTSRITIFLDNGEEGDMQIYNLYDHVNLTFDIDVTDMVNDKNKREFHDGELFISLNIETVINILAIIEEVANYSDYNYPLHYLQLFNSLENISSNITVVTSDGENVDFLDTVTYEYFKYMIKCAYPHDGDINYR